MSCSRCDSVPSKVSISVTGVESKEIPLSVSALSEELLQLEEAVAEISKRLSSVVRNDPVVNKTEQVRCRWGIQQHWQTGLGIQL